MSEPTEIFCITDQAEGALPNGTRIAKINSMPDDTHGDGALGTVLGSIKADPPVEGEHYGYFVEWDDLPGLPVGVTGSRIEEVERE